VIDAAKKILSENGLSVTQLPSSNSEQVIVTTMLMHSSGQWISDILTLKPTKTDPQGMGSAITYARRYAYSAIIGMSTEEDDDGNSASKPAKTIQHNEKLDYSIPREAVQETTQSFKEFDCTIEVISFGKYSAGKDEGGATGKIWAELPLDYLQWIAKSEKSTPDARAKANATVEYKQAIHDQIPDPMDAVFGKKNEPEPSQLTPVEILQNFLEIAIRNGSVEALEGWKKINQKELDALNPTDKAGIKNIYTKALNQIKKGGAK
jgi:hypothetical protein